MHRKLLATATLCLLTGVISACNSTDSPYSQGPWGPAHVRRNYLEYSAPWGYRSEDSSQFADDGKAIVAPGAVRTTVSDISRIHELPIEDVIEPDPRELEVDTARRPGPALEPEFAVTPRHHPQQQVNQASAPLQPSPPGIVTPPRSASSYAGSWKAAVGSSSCKVQLSSVPSLDLYKASTNGCSNDALQSVNGWSFRDNQVILFTRGQPVARLSGAEAALTGTLNSSELAISLTR